MAKLVQFSDGSYGVRAHWRPFFGWFFYDMEDRGFKWTRRSRFFQSCQTSRERAEAFYAALHLTHRVVAPRPPQGDHDDAPNAKGGG